MKGFEKQKKNLNYLKSIKDFKFLLKNKILEDIYVYGSQNDIYSDLDLFFVVKNFKNNPAILREYVIKHNAIVIPSELKKDIFYFDNFKIFSIKNFKIVKNNTINKKIFKRILLYSFYDRYFERYATVKNRLNRYTKLHVRILKSYLFSLFIFTKIFPKEKKIKVKIMKLIKNYSLERKKLIKNKKNYKKIHQIILKNLELFHKEVHSIISDNFKSDFPNTVFVFKKGYIFKNLNFYKKLNDNEICVPNHVNEYFYKYSLNKSIFFKNMHKNFKLDFLPDLQKYDFIQNKKIKLILNSAKILKKLNLKSNIIRWFWLLP